MTDAHHLRAHAEWAASATARNTTCAGAVAMARLAGPEAESEAAAWGTACHQIAEICLRQGLHADAALGSVQTTEGHEFTVDEEMVNCAQEFIDYCRRRCDEYQHTFHAEIAADPSQDVQSWVERNFSFAALDPPFEAGGTGDFIAYFPFWKMLEIADLKGGRGVLVEVRNNGQARSYALGAMLEFPKLDVETVRSTIVQPRAPHRDGRVRSEEIHVADLVDWTAWLLARMNSAREALDAFPGTGNRVAFEEWAERWLTTGACTFCPAEGFCPKRRREALAAAGRQAAEWFEDPSAPGAPPANRATVSSAEELGHTLDGLEALESWIRAVRSHALARAERGEAVPGWTLVDKIGNRAWIETSEAKLAAAIWKDLKLSRDEMFEKPKIKSVAQIEKTLGRRRDELVKLEDALWHKPKKGKNLVSAQQTTRAPAQSRPEQHFEAADE